MNGLLSQFSTFQVGLLVLTLWISTTIGTTLLQIYAFRRPALVQKVMTRAWFVLAFCIIAILVVAGLGL